MRGKGGEVLQKYSLSLSRYFLDLRFPYLRKNLEKKSVKKRHFRPSCFALTRKVEMSAAISSLSFLTVREMSRAFLKN